MKLALALIAVALMSTPALAQSSENTLLDISPDMAPPDILPNGIDVFGGYRPQRAHPGGVFMSPKGWWFGAAEPGRAVPAKPARRAVPVPDLESELPLICADVGRRYTGRLCQGPGLSLLHRFSYPTDSEQ
jgi:hypothetical protein